MYRLRHSPRAEENADLAGPRSLTALGRIGSRISDAAWRIRDAIELYRLRNGPDAERQRYLLVSCESSGTTPVSHLLFLSGGHRFLIEGRQPWVWDVYMSVYQKRASIGDFPRLRLFDAIKVPGFATILEEFVAEFPKTEIVYLLRDPRDVIASTFRTWNITEREQLRNVPWVSQQWLGIRSADPIARLAERWVIYFERSQRVPGVHYVRYEDFCADKVGVIVDLAERIGLHVDRAELGRRCDAQASSFRKYSPAGVGSWRPYLDAHDLEIIDGICGEHMSRWRYDQDRTSS